MSAQLTTMKVNSCPIIMQFGWVKMNSKKTCHLGDSAMLHTKNSSSITSSHLSSVHFSQNIIQQILFLNDYLIDEEIN